ncbi:hypothetical protein GLYMA_06G276150v4 [Glycine max]|nr:hypothetical protein GLYMA_06G276150v4 [Glycine max]KAH1127894.1 hypothetical protein GYH30_016450 [Glycine max]
MLLLNSLEGIRLMSLLISEKCLVTFFINQMNLLDRTVKMAAELIIDEPAEQNYVILLRKLHSLFRGGRQN